MRPSTLDSMLLASTDPERLGSWYASVFEPEHDTRVNGYRMLRFGTFTLLIDHRDDVGDTNPEPGRVIVNFDVTDAHAIVDRLEAMQAAWLAPLEDRDGTRFATAIDPDGNYVQLVQLDPRDRARRQSTDEGGLLDTSRAFSGFAVDDVETAQDFYRNTLELRTSVDHGLLTLHLAGGRDVLVYPKADHRPARFTVLNFPVDAIDHAVDVLVSRGVEFVRYDRFPADDRGIHRSPAGPPIAWLTDPAGNILSVLEA